MASNCRYSLRVIVGYSVTVIILLCFVIVLPIWASIKDSSSHDPIKPVFRVMNATMAIIAYRGDNLTADFSFTLTAANSNKNKTIEFTNSTEATGLYFEREAELATPVASSTALPVPSPLPPRSSDNVIAFGLHAQDAPLDAGNSQFFRTGKSGYSTFDDRIFARLVMNFMARFDEKSTYELLKVICRGLKYSSQGFEVKDNWCVAYYGD